MKERITITIDKELLEWLDRKIDEKVFANRSHGLEFLIKRRMEARNEENSEVGHYYPNLGIFGYFGLWNRSSRWLLFYADCLSRGVATRSSHM